MNLDKIKYVDIYQKMCEIVSILSFLSGEGVGNEVGVGVRVGVTL